MRKTKLLTNELLKRFDISEDLGDLLTYSDKLNANEFEDFIRLIIVFIEPTPEREKIIKLAIVLKIENLPFGVLKEYGTKYLRE